MPKLYLLKLTINHFSLSDHLSLITWVAGHVGLSHPLSPAKGTVALRGLWHGVQPRGPDLRAAEGWWTVGFGQGGPKVWITKRFENLPMKQWCIFHSYSGWKIWKIWKNSCINWDDIDGLSWFIRVHSYVKLPASPWFSDHGWSRSGIICPRAADF